MQIAARKVFENDVVEDCTSEIASSPMSDPANYIGMTNTVESYGFVLEILNESTFQISIKIVLQENVKCLDDNLSMR